MSIPVDFSTMKGIKRHNKETGHHFFSKGAMRFFDSKIHTRIPIHGCMFVTSERGPDRIRKYTIRCSMSDGGVKTVGEFQQFGSLLEARKAAINLGRPSFEN